MPHHTTICQWERRPLRGETRSGENTHAAVKKAGLTGGAGLTRRGGLHLGCVEHADHEEAPMLLLRRVCRAVSLIGTEVARKSECSWSTATRECKVNLC